MKQYISKKLLSFIIAIPAIFTVLTIYSFRLPYIPSEEYLNSIKVGVFPLFVVSLILFISLKKWKKTGLTGLQMRLKDTHRLTDKIKIVIQLMITVPAFVALMLWALHCYIAWPLKLVQTEQFSFQVKITEHNPLRRTMSGLTKLTFIHDCSTKPKTLRWATEKAKNYKVGDTLIFTGKQTWFGIIVEQVNKVGT